jgi:hypothetical protein
MLKVKWKLNKKIMSKEKSLLIIRINNQLNKTSIDLIAKYDFSIQY